MKSLTLLNYLYVGVLGVGCIVIVNCIYTDLSFFIEELPNTRIEFVIPMLLNVPQVLGQLFAIKYLSQVPLKAIVISMTVVAGVVSMCIPAFMCTSSKLWLTMLSMAYFGFFMAIINSGVIGYVS